MKSGRDPATPPREGRGGSNVEQVTDHSHARLRNGSPTTGPSSPAPATNSRGGMGGGRRVNRTSIALLMRWRSSPWKAPSTATVPSPLSTDVTSITQVQRTVGTALAEFGCLDIVVNNAGGTGPFGPFLVLPHSAQEQAMRLNSESTLHV